MGLVELGRQTGLSASFLSQLETGRVVPTLRNLARIAIVFGKDLSHFFESGDQHVFRVQRRKDRVRIPMGAPEPHYITESFGIVVPDSAFRPCMAEFLPGPSREAFRPGPFPGVEMVYVLSGTLEVCRNSERHLLEPRDVLYISGETLRSYRAATRDPAQALIMSFDLDSIPGPLANRTRFPSLAAKA
jgi:Cupin domain/Helix-turn-helix